MTSDSTTSNEIDAQTASDFLVAKCIEELTQPGCSSSWAQALSAHIPRMAKLGHAVKVPGAIMAEVMEMVAKSRSKKADAH